MSSPPYSPSPLSLHITRVLVEYFHRSSFFSSSSNMTRPFPVSPSPSPFSSTQQPLLCRGNAHPLSIVSRLVNPIVKLQSSKFSLNLWPKQIRFCSFVPNASQTKMIRVFKIFFFHTRPLNFDMKRFFK